MGDKTNINFRNNNEDLLLNKYIEEISGYTPLSDKEEADLAKEAKNGSQQAKDKLIKSNLKFVVSIARQYASDGKYMLDLINEGNIALICAADKFDEQKGKRFSKYAIWEIRKAMEAFLPKEEIKVNRTVTDHLPANAKDIEKSTENNMEIDVIQRKMHYLPIREQNVLKAYFGINEQQKTMAEIGLSLNMTRERVRQIRNRALRRLYSYRNFNN